jgi:methylenetetrahydrofolate reductase (NADPH)
MSGNAGTIRDVLATGERTFSFEFFPPKTDDGERLLWQAIRELEPLRPHFVSVTYGAGGSTRERTVAMTERIAQETTLTPLGHLTAVNHSVAELRNIVGQFAAAGVRNVLALRGDPPAGQSSFVATQGGFSNADGLTKFVRGRHDFCIGVAGYPEGHPQCLNRTRDLEHLKRKVDHGANFIVTQLFFDNAEFYRFRDEARLMGINVPIVAGIMPITNVGQIKRFVSMCGAKIPHRLLTKLETVENASAEEIHKVGVDYACMQCKDLLFNDVDGLHFYTLNKSKATVDIVRDLNVNHSA